MDKKIFNKSKKVFSKEQRDEAVYYFVNKIYTADEIVDMYGCAKPTLYDWVKKYKQNNIDLESIKEIDTEKVAMKKTIIELEEQIRILKKALSIVNSN